MGGGARPLPPFVAREPDVSETPQETISRLRALLARTYRAAVKPEWEEGELNEVVEDIREALSAFRSTEPQSAAEGSRDD